MCNGIFSFLQVAAFSDGILVFLFNLDQFCLELIDFSDQTLKIFRTIFDIAFQLVDQTLEIVRFYLFLRDTLVFGCPFLFDLFNSGIQLGQFGVVLKIRVPQRYEQGLGFVYLGSDGPILINCQLYLQVFDLFLIRLVALSFFGLALKTVHLAFYFGDHIIDTKQILLGALYLL